jgi:RNA polymerase sigma-70 factor (ECF subfamily)
MSERIMTDEEIMACLCAGDQSAFHFLYERYAARGVCYAQSLLKNRYDAEEAVQEAFCRLLKPLKRGAVSGKRGGFGALFFKTLRNLCIDALRRKKGHLSIEAVPEPSAPSQSGRAAEVEGRVKAALDALPPKHGEALKLKLEGGLSYREIAGILDCTHTQVRTWIYRARRSLEEDFRKEGLIS